MNAAGIAKEIVNEIFENKAHFIKKVQTNVAVINLLIDMIKCCHEHNKRSQQANYSLKFLTKVKNSYNITTYIYISK